MKILITGCRGQLGTELQKQLAAESCVLGPLPERLRKATIIPVDVDELDITDREAAAQPASSRVQASAAQVMRNFIKIHHLFITRETQRLPCVKGAVSKAD